MKVARLPVFISLLFVSCFFITSAQDNRCLFNQVNEYRLQNDITYKKLFADFKSLPNKSYLRTSSLDSVVYIPVVIHVLYNTEAENISYDQIKSQIDVLNEDFAAINATVLDVPSEWQNLITDSKIRFKLAVQDPSGQLTTGVERVKTNVTAFPILSSSIFQSSQGGTPAWDARNYLNIWICTLEDNGLGFASFPGSSPSQDGVVISNRAFGRVGLVKSPYNLGRTCSHEVGHYFNLYHIWGDDNGFCNGKDFYPPYTLFDDTPNQADSHFRCPKFPNLDSCTSAAPGVMFMNFMDYTDDKCMMFFTPGQIGVMHEILNDSLKRASLKSSNALQYTTRFNVDLGIDSIELPVKFLSERCFIPKVKLHNYGTENIYGGKLVYKVNGGIEKKFAFNDTINPSSTLTLSLNEMSSDVGNQVFEIYVIASDSNIYNNYYSSSFKVNNSTNANCSTDGLFVFPNPLTISTSVCLKVKVDKSQDSNLRIYNSIGQLLHEEDVKINPSDAIVLDLKNYEAGLLIIQIQGEQYKQSARLIYMPNEEITPSGFNCN